MSEHLIDEHLATALAAADTITALRARVGALESEVARLSNAVFAPQGAANDPATSVAVSDTRVSAVNQRLS